MGRVGSFPMVGVWLLLLGNCPVVSVQNAIVASKISKKIDPLTQDGDNSKGVSGAPMAFFSQFQKKVISKKTSICLMSLTKHGEVINIVKTNPGALIFAVWTRSVGGMARERFNEKKSGVMGGSFFLS